MRSFREDRGLSKAALGRLLNISPVYVGYLEEGARFPGLEVATRIREATADWDRGPIVGDEWVAAKQAARESEAEVA